MINQKIKSKLSIKCPSCQFDNSVLLGAIPASDTFAGQRVSPIIKGGYLYMCKNCNLYYKYPRLSQDYYEKLYINANIKSWQYKNKVRKDWDYAKEWILKKNGGKILDVACWNGEFLKLLDKKWEKYGVELNENASQQAEKSGIKIITSNINSFNGNINDTFDVITAFDIIEHVEDPKSFLQRLIKHTKNGCYIIISTGNTNAYSWKIMKNYYYYCWLPEHISFLNNEWFSYFSKEFDYDIVDTYRFSHAIKNSIVEYITQLLKCNLYLLSNNLYFKIKKSYSINKNISYQPPSWNLSKDHLLFVLKKK